VRSNRLRSAAAGILVANSAPHIASAVAGRRHLTPFGRESGPALNGHWAVINLLGGALLLQGSRKASNPYWNEDLHAFEAGYLGFALWMAASERALKINTHSES
jgi:hypothetical protein